MRSNSALVLDRDSGAVLYEKNPDAVLPIASITKLMTAVVVTEANLPLDEVLTISQEDVDAAFADFDPAVVAEFGASDRERLLADPGIIRNRAKVDATITNARALRALRDEQGEGALERLMLEHAPDEADLRAEGWRRRARQDCSAVVWRLVALELRIAIGLVAFRLRRRPDQSLVGGLLGQQLDAVERGP